MTSIRSERVADEEGVGHQSKRAKEPTSPAQREAAPSALSDARPQSPVDLDTVDGYMAAATINNEMISQVQRRLETLLRDEQIEARTAVDCRGSICKIDVDVEESQARKLQNLAPIENTQFTYEIRKAGDSKIGVTVYRTAPGLTFAQVLASANLP